MPHLSCCLFFAELDKKGATFDPGCAACLLQKVESFLVFIVSIYYHPTDLVTFLSHHSLPTKPTYLKAKASSEMWFCSILHTCVDLVWSLQWGFFIKEQISRHRWVVYGWRIDELGGCEKLILKFVGSRHGGRCGLGGGGISSWRRLCGWEGEIAFGFGCHSCGLRCLLRDSQGVLERRSRPFGVCSLQGCYRLQCPVFLCCNFWKVRETSNHNPALSKWLSEQNFGKRVGVLSWSLLKVEELECPGFAGTIGRKCHPGLWGSSSWWHL